MRILIGHNYYQLYGGEDAVVDTEANILRSKGHQVEIFTKDNKDIKGYSFLQKINHACHLSWSKESYTEFRAKIRECKPDVVHFHNIYFMLSPSVYYACKDEKVPVVQSLHNFRILCANGLFYRDGHVCEDCMTQGLDAGVKNKCFQNSWLKSKSVVRMLKEHHQKRTWQDNIGRFITATEFTRKKYIEAGFDPNKIKVKPNVFELPDEPLKEDKGYVLHIGRLSEEKGIDLMLEAYRNNKDLPPLKIIGDGVMRDHVKRFIKDHQLKHVEYLGFVSEEQYHQYMIYARALLVPVRCYENFPRVVVEAYAYGIPVVASRIGSLEEVVDDGITGYFVDPGSAEDLAQKLRSIQIEDLSKMRQNARSNYDIKYCVQRNYELLVAIYQEALTA